MFQFSTLTNAPYSIHFIITIFLVSMITIPSALGILYIDTDTYDDQTKHLGTKYVRPDTHYSTTH